MTMTIAPAILSKTEWLSLRKLPSVVAAAPKAVNTTAKPSMNSNVPASTRLLPVPSVRLSPDKPETNDR